MVVYCLLIPLCGLFLLRTSAIQVNLIALGLASVVYSLLTFIYQQIRRTASRPVMQGIVTPSPRKDFQPPLGIFLPSKEKEIIILEKQIIILGKIPVSYAIRTKAWYEKYQYWYKKYQALVEKVPHLEFGREGRNVERLKLKVERGEF